MVNLATVFSGIGAIEHALNRMGIDNKIVFACDNGDVDILQKKVPLDIDSIEKEIESLERTIKDIGQNNYKVDLQDSLSKVSSLYRQHLLDLESVSERVTESILLILEIVTTGKNIKKSRLKEYSVFKSRLQSIRDNANAVRLYSLCYAIEIVNDFHKDNPWSSLGKTSNYKSSDGVDWKQVELDVINLKSFIDRINGRKLLKKVKDVCERLGMLHEKILTLKINETLSKLDTYDQKKEYVDSLYKGKEKQNKVKTSYMANYDIDDRHFYWNVSFLDGQEYRNQVDLFVGGSPCQSFSLVGKQRGLEDNWV